VSITWHPMASAPKDGTHILLLVENAVIQAWWRRDWWEVPHLNPMGCGCCSSNLDPPVAWSPMPEWPTPRAILQERHIEILDHLVLSGEAEGVSLEEATVVGHFMPGKGLLRQHNGLLRSYHPTSQVDIELVKSAANAVLEEWSNA